MKGTTSLRHVLSVIFKYKNVSVALLLATVASVLIATQVIPPTYESASSVMVNFGREYLYLPEVGNDSPYNYYNRASIINTELEIMSSRDLLEKVLQSIGIDKIYPVKKRKKEMTPAQRMDEALLKFTKKLKITGGSESNIIRVSFQHNDPRIAADTVNAMIDFFKEKHLKAFRDPTVSSFLEEKATHFRTKLIESEARLKAFKEKHLANSVQEQESLLLLQQSTLTTSLKEARRSISELTERLDSLKSQTAAMSESIPIFSQTGEDSRAVDHTKQQLLTLQLEEQDLLEKYNEEHQKVVTVRTEIKLVKDFLKEQQAGVKDTVRTGKSTVYQEIEKEIVLTTASLSAQHAKEKTIENQLKDLEKDIKAYSAAEQEIQGIKRELATNKQTFKIYQGKVEEAKISDEMDKLKMTNIRVVQKATIPGKPVKPNLPINIIVGIILGILAGLGVSFFNEYVSQTLNSAESVEKHLAVPVLGTVSFKKNI